ncbi:MAG: hypothetical protein ACKORB_03315, partial [Opitutia bacterium]
LVPVEGVPVEGVPEVAEGEFDAGFSLYAAAWRLVERYPGSRFQTGLFGTWMFARFGRTADGKHDPADKPDGMYSDIEGGLGWWRDTRFPTETPKFIMGGVGVNFHDIANGPAYGRGSWDDPRGLYGVAQLTPWLLFPPDGLNLQQGVKGGLFGYGYLPMPFARAKTRTEGKDVPTGDNCWTLFLNAANFKGPVCFFTPNFWARSALRNPEVAGQMLDSRGSDPNKAFQMETQYVPASQAVDEKGVTYARVAPTSFPVGADGTTVVLHRLTCYDRSALYDGVKAWFEGGPAVTGAVRAEGSFLQKFRPNGGSTWSIYKQGTKREAKPGLAWKAFATPHSPDPSSYGYKWDDSLVTRADGLVTLPQYYRFGPGGKNGQWTPVKPGEVPASTGLADLRFDRPQEKPQPARETPVGGQASEAARTTWKTPGPKAGPFRALLGDGSVVTYYWYRFADQPALLNADLTAAEREAMQVKVEKLHRSWTKDRDYLAPPTVGTLAGLDPAQLVTPPPGLEVGHVPIATRQELPAAAPAGR